MLTKQRRWALVVLLVVGGWPRGALAQPRPERTDHSIGINLGVGAAFAGEAPQGANGATGNGLMATAGVIYNPLWIAGHGFGLGLDFGIKYSAVQTLQGSYDFRRFPLVLSAHALMLVAERWYFLFATGPQLELGLQLSRGGSVSGGEQVALDDALGWMAEAGVLYIHDHVGVDASLRFTVLTYETPWNPDVDANNVGVFAGIHYLL